VVAPKNSGRSEIFTSTNKTDFLSRQDAKPPRQNIVVGCFYLTTIRRLKFFGVKNPQPLISVIKN
jgi:hypothetical protein